jgi:hypothetical protein
MDMRFALLIALVLTAGGLTVLIAALFAGSPGQLAAGLPAVAGAALVLRLLTARRG